jgi:hypothetical protein
VSVYVSVTLQLTFVAFILWLFVHVFAFFFVNMLCCASTGI